MRCEIVGVKRRDAQTGLQRVKHVFRFVDEETYGPLEGPQTQWRSVCGLVTTRRVMIVEKQGVPICKRCERRR